MRFNHLTIARKIYGFSAIFAITLILPQLALLYDIRLSSNLVKQQNGSLVQQVVALEAQELALAQQEDSIATQAKINEITNRFSQIRFRLYDWAISGEAGSLQYAQTTYQQLQTTLAKMVEQDDELEELQETVDSFYRQMHQAMLNYQQPGKVHSELLDQARDTGHMAVSLLMDVLSSADLEEKDNRLALNQAKENLSQTTDALRQDALAVAQINDELFIFSWGILIFIILICMGYSLLLHFNLVPGLLFIKNAIEQIDQQSDLSKRIELNGHAHDEIGDTAQAFNRMLAQFQNIVEQVVDATQTVNDSISQAEQMMADSKGSARQQHLETQLVAQSMAEMSAAIVEVAHNSQDASEATQEAQSNAHQGHQVVKGAIVTINEMATTMDQLGSTINQVSEASNNIDMVLDVIRAISDQTNLLALNAAIEAARAGENGRGFAVVADEVRALASRTTESTEQIRLLIESLQNSTKKAVKDIELSQQQTKNGVMQADAAGEALLKIDRAVSKINVTNNDIADATQSQANVAKDINQKIVLINDITHITSKSVSSTSDSLVHLKALSNRLGALVSRFNV